MVTKLALPDERGGVESLETGILVSLRGAWIGCVEFLRRSVNEVGGSGTVKWVSLGGDGAWSLLLMVEKVSLDVSGGDGGLDGFGSLRGACGGLSEFLNCSA